MTERELICQTIDMIGSLRSGEKTVLAEKIRSYEDLFELSSSFLAHVTGRRPRLQESPSELLKEAEEILKRCERDRIGCLTRGDDDYPANLAAIHDPPFRLYFRGESPRRDWDGVAVVGTRLPTLNAKAEAFQFGLELASMECPLISGLALGVDGEAHKGALAGHGRTVAVLGSGVDILTPARNSRIGQDILLNGGTVLSEYAPGTPGARWRYPARNRIIAGLSQAVVVVQAPRRSGALITAEFALDEGRDVVITPAGIWAEGTAGLLRSGAPVVESAFDILKELNIDTRGWVEPRLPEPKGREDLVSYMSQELKGEVISHGGRYYRVS